MLGALFPPNGRYALLVALTASQDLFDHANDLFVEAKPPGLGQCSSHGKACCPGNLSLVVLLNWPPFRPDTRHNLEGLRLSSSTGLCLTTTNVSN